MAPKASLVPSQQFTLQAAQTSAIVNGTTTRGSLSGLDGFVDLAVLISIASGSAATGQLNLFVQDSWDGGTTWDDVIASNNFTFGAAAVTQRFIISGRIDTTATQGSAVSVEALTAGTVRKGAWGPMLRVREKITLIAGSPTGVTYSIALVAKR